MFGPNTLRTTLTLPKVLSTISQGLNIANKAIPIYKEIKPVVTNAKKLMVIAKEFRNVKSPSSDKKQIKKEVITNTTSYNNPIFFQ